MKFIHIGDTHIGNVYKNDTRNDDVKNSFKQVVDAVIKEHVDFVVHSGDLFNEGNPSLNALLFVTDQLNRLKEAGIKVFIVPGSHDVGMGDEDSIVELFDRNGLLVNLNSVRYISNEDSGFYLSGETYRNAFICGVRGKRSKVENDIFKRLRVKMDDKAWIRIFVFHHTISTLGEQFKDLETESLPKGFEYYAAGHWHGRRDNINYDKGVIQYPGSTEYCDEKEIVDNPNRGYYLIEYDEKGIEKLEYCLLKTREKEIIRINANQKTANEIESEVFSKLSKNTGKILVVKIDGKIFGKRGELNVSHIKKEAIDAGYSYVSINTSKIFDSDDNVIDIKDNELNNVESEFLKGRGYSEEEITLAKMLIDLTTTKTNPELIKRRAEETFDKYDIKRA